MGVERLVVPRLGRTLAESAREGAMRGEFQECGYECCIAMSHRRRHRRRYRHHLLTTAPPPIDRGKGQSINDVHKIFILVNLILSRNLSVMFAIPNQVSVRMSFMDSTYMEGVIAYQARGWVSAYANVAIRKRAL